MQLFTSRWNESSILMSYFDHYKGKSILWSVELLTLDVTGRSKTFITSWITLMSFDEEFIGGGLQFIYGAAMPKQDLLYRSEVSFLGQRLMQCLCKPQIKASHVECPFFILSNCGEIQFDMETTSACRRLRIKSQKRILFPFVCPQRH